MALWWGLSPVSRRIANLGLRIYLWQKPLKNQLWDDSFPLFLYLTHKNKFIFIFFSYSSSSKRLYSYFFTFFFSFLGWTSLKMGTWLYSFFDSSSRKTPVRKAFTYAKWSRLAMYSLQYRLASLSAESIMALLRVRLFAYSWTKAYSLSWLTWFSSSPKSYFFCYFAFFR